LQQEFVTRLCQFINAPSVRLPENACDDSFLAARRPIGEVSQVLPPRRDRTGKMLHEVLDPALAATKVEQHARSHDSPAQPGAPTDGSVGICDIHDTQMNQIDTFSINCRLQPIGNMSDDFLADMNRLFADRRVKVNRTLYTKLFFICKEIGRCLLVGFQGNNDLLSRVVSTRKTTWEFMRAYLVKRSIHGRSRYVQESISCW
jgi:hypothetical protein